MERKPFSVQRNDGTIYYAWSSEEMSSMLALLNSLSFEAHKYYNHYKQAVAKKKEHEAQYNWAMLMNVKEKIEDLKKELTRDH